MLANDTINLVQRKLKLRDVLRDVTQQRLNLI